MFYAQILRIYSLQRLFYDKNILVADELIPTYISSRKSFSYSA